MMKRFSLIAATFLIGSVAFAQPPQGGFQGGGQGGRGGFGGPGGPGGFMMGGGMNRPVSVSNIPLRVLSAYLGLSDAQKGQIAEAREEMQEAMRPQMPRRNVNDGNDGPPRFDPEQMEAQRQSAEKKGAREINEILSDAQRSKLSVLTKALQALQAAGIRSEAALKLRLTDEQLSKLAGMNANAASTRAETVLTEEQKEIAEDYKMPMGRPGGRGGFVGPGGGPGGQGGFGGPPGGGQGGPPPF